MTNIVEAQVTIKGTRPLLFHKFGREAMPLEKQEKTGVAGHNPEEWKKTFTTTRDRQLYVDPSYVFASFRAGAKYTKKGRGSIQRLVAATLQVVDNRIMIDRYVPESLSEITEDQEEEVYIDVRGVRNPGTRGMNIRYRLAVAPGWKTTFKILWDKTVVSRAQMEAVAIDAGRLCGIGDGRAIGMGRYEIVSFEIEEDAEE